MREATGAAFTGAVARVEARGTLVFEAAYGTTRDDALARPVFVDTRFDLASLTKLFLASVALKAVDEGLLTLEAPLARSIPDAIPQWKGNAHEAVTLRMLLAHTSGMNSGADYRELLGDNVQAFALRRALVAQPGERVVYSDLGFIALGTMLERLYGASLPTLIARLFPSSNVGYAPRERERRWIPATEEDAWRGRVQGFVHDEKAYLMNGVAGHAGLFGTASDVAALTESMLASRLGRASRLPPVLSQPLAVAATSEAAYDPVLRRALGWALKTSDDNSCGRAFSMESFGHTGFTGTCVWADPERDLQAVLLTNTVYFDRSDSRPLRAAFYDAVVEAMDRSPV
ncbi:MAG TPA: serine hydrolase domain-containing protein [Candidatus Baltobacteraceae bacterium]|nr:serine hydrolase domain-containing protein [Candidatus Baltobacteraceae bacterium]